MTKRRENTTDLSKKRKAEPLSDVTNKFQKISINNNTEINTKPKTKKNRKKTNDSTYNSKTYSYDNKPKHKDSDADEHPSIFAMRADHSKSFIDENGNEVILKTAIAIDASHHKKEDLSPLKENIAPNLKTIANSKAIGQFTEFNKNGSPIKGITSTPSKTELTRITKMGSMSIFSNKQPPKKMLFSTSKIELSDDFLQSEQYEAIKKIQTTYKIQETKVTNDELKRVKKENEKNNNVRSISQNKVMVEENVNAKEGSATKYVQATEIFSNNMKWEWLHLIAHMVLGKTAQKSDNLVAGTPEANTHMLICESELKTLAQAYPDGFNLRVEADLIEGSHIATEIRYYIKTKHFDLPIVIDAQLQQKPHASHQAFFHLYVQSLVKAANKTTQTPSQDSLSKEEDPYPNLFYKTPSQS